MANSTATTHDARHRVHARPRPLRLDDGRRRIDDRLRHFHRLGRHGAQRRQRRLAAVAWLLTGVLTIVGALSYGELAAMMPRAGGQYVYLREAFSPLWGFLYGWTLFLVIQTGTIAAVAVGFARYFGVLVPWIAEDHYLIAPLHLSTGYALSLSTTQLVGDPADRAADLDEHARARIRPHRPERLHDREDRRPGRTDPASGCCSDGIRPRWPTTSATSGRGAAPSTSCPA